MGLVKRGFGVGLAPANQAVISTSVDIFDSQGNNIGYITNWNPSHDRATTPVRHLDSADAGRIVEQVPSPENYKATVTGFALYNKSATARTSLLNRIPGSVAAAFKTLNEQQIPFTLRITETHPGTGEKNETFWIDCMLTNYSHPVAIGTATIAETASITASHVE